MQLVLLHILVITRHHRGSPERPQGAVEGEVVGEGGEAGGEDGGGGLYTVGFYVVGGLLTAAVH